MNLKHLSDEALLESTRRAAKNERHATTVVLHHLLEVEARRLFSPKFESLMAYCVGELKYSGSSAQRRLDAMRVLKVIPEIEEKIESGSLNLTTLSQAQTFFRAEAKVENRLAPEAKREVLAELENKSTREVDRELIGRATEPLALTKDRVRVVSATLSELKCLVKDETLEDFKKLRGLLAHKDPHLSMGELLEQLAKIALQALDPAKEPKRVPAKRVTTTAGTGSQASDLRTAKPAPVSQRYIQAQVKREVWRLAQGKCTSCGSIHRLQIDHIEPHAKGGSNELGNLRLLCFHCNQREADRKLGRETMELKRKQVPVLNVQGLAGGTAAQHVPR